MLDGFIDTNTYYKRLNKETSKEELVKITDVDGNVLWERPDPCSREDFPWNILLPKAQQIIAKGGSITDTANELGVPYKALWATLRKEMRTDRPGNAIREEKKTELEGEADVSAKLDAYDPYTGPFEKQATQVSTTDSFEKQVTQVLTEIQSILIRKRQDYGPGNIPRFGEKGVVVRLFDKAERLASLVWDGKSPNFEAVEDTWLDVIGYGVLGLLEHRKREASA